MKYEFKEIELKELDNVSGGRAIRDSERAEMLAVGNSINEARSDHL